MLVEKGQLVHLQKTSMFNSDLVRSLEISLGTSSALKQSSLSKD